MTEYDQEAQFLERIQRGEKISDPGEMPSGFKDAVSELLTIQAKCEFHGGNNELFYCARLAQTYEDREWITHTGFEEIGHARILVEGSLHTLGIVPVFKSDPRHEQKILRIFQRYDLFETWPDVRMFAYLMDGAAGQQLSEFKQGPYLPWTRDIERIEEEEAGHTKEGELGIREWAERPDGLAELQSSLDKWIELVLDVFGSLDTQSHELSSRKLPRYLKYRLKQQGNNASREQFKAHIKSFLIDEIGLTSPLL